jgi:hypothetical protein
MWLGRFPLTSLSESIICSEFSKNQGLFGFIQLDWLAEIGTSNVAV